MGASLLLIAIVATLMLLLILLLGFHGFLAELFQFVTFLLFPLQLFVRLLVREFGQNEHDRGRKNVIAKRL